METFSPVDFDVAVVGGSLAGAVTALKFGERGLRVALIEKDKFPRRKACGEGLAATAADLLASLGLEFGKLTHQSLGGYVIHGKGGSARIGGSKVGTGIQRSVLDAAVHELALRCPSVERISATKVQHVELSRGSAQLAYGRGKLSAHVCVLADGVNSVIARRLKIPESVYSVTRYGASLICKVSADLCTVGIVALPGAEIYVTPLGSGLANFSMLGKRDALHQILQPSGLDRFVSIAEERLGTQLEIVEDVLSAGAIAPVRRPEAFGRAVLVGDCCEALDPISGMGMTHAVQSGISAAEALLPFFERECSFEQCANSYTLRHSELVQPLRGYTRLAFLLVNKLQSSLLLKMFEQAGLLSRFRDAALDRTRRSLTTGLLLRLAGSHS